MSEPPSPHHFQTDQPRELLACVEFSAMQAARIVEDPGAFRWIVVAMTLAVQNACLCALDHGDEDGTRGMTRMDARAVQRWRRSGREGEKPLALREPRIVSPLELVRRVADPAFLRPPYQLPLSRSMHQDFDDLVELRNTFLHFSQDGWTTDLRDLPPMIVSACAIIRHLSVVQPIYLRNAGRGHRDRVAEALAQIVSAMEHYPANDDAEADDR